MAKKDMQYVMQTEASQILPFVRGKDGWLVDSYGQPVFPGDEQIDIAVEKDVFSGVYKSDSMRGLITAYKKLSAELKKEKAAAVKDIRKIERCEKRLASLKENLLSHTEYIKNHLKLDIQTIISEYTR